MNEHIQKVLNHPQSIPVAVGVVAFGVGAGLGYILGRRNKYESVVTIEPESHDDPNQMKIDFDAEELAEELEYIRETAEEKLYSRTMPKEQPVYETNPETGKMELVGYENLSTKEVRPVDEFVASKLKEVMESRKISDPEPIRKDIFAKSEDTWDYEEELKHRTTTAPYILHKDEFYADEKDYAQLTLTYYEGDDILVDDDDSPIYNHIQVVGDLNWGHGCDDPNVVHIRNDRRRAEYEVLRHEGLYSVEILGLEIENNHRVRDLKHSTERKFRLTE